MGILIASMVFLWISLALYFLPIRYYVFLDQFFGDKASPYYEDLKYSRKIFRLQTSRRTSQKVLRGLKRLGVISFTIGLLFLLMYFYYGGTIPELISVVKIPVSLTLGLYVFFLHVTEVRDETGNRLLRRDLLATSSRFSSEVVGKKLGDLNSYSNENQILLFIRLLFASYYFMIRGLLFQKMTIIIIIGVIKVVFVGIGVLAVFNLAVKIMG